MSEAGYRGPQVCSIVGITYRQLDYWARTDLIRPSLADAKGSGSQRRYSYRDLVELKVIKSENLGEDVATANLVINGTGSILARNGDELIDILRNGQTVFNIVALAGVQEQVDAAIRELAPAGGEDVAGEPPVSVAN
jgi:DNA-binding transcriptional MerR regulator